MIILNFIDDIDPESFEQDIEYCDSCDTDCLEPKDYEDYTGTGQLCCYCNHDYRENCCVLCKQRFKNHHISKEGKIFEDPVTKEKFRVFEWSEPSPGMIRAIRKEKIQS